MKRFCYIALACSAVLLSQGACTKTQEPSAGSEEFAPLVDFYDNVWVRSSDGKSATLDQVAKDLGEYDVVFFGEYHGHSGVHLAQMQLFRSLHERSEEHTSELQ